MARLYIVNMPRLRPSSASSDGNGVAGGRTSCWTNLGPKPRPGGLNDHIVSGLQFGMDGWLYISVGD